MTRPAAPTRDLLGLWCGWVLVGAAALTPLLAWLGPLGFAALLSLIGLLALPALRMTDEDRPAVVVLLALLIWAAVTTTWSPYHPKLATSSVALKLALELPLYFSAVCAARRADPELKRLALRVLAWGMAGLGLLLIVEAVTGAAIYLFLHERLYEPIRPDWGWRNLAQSTFVLALLLPLASLGAPQKLRPWLVLAMAAGVAVAALRFGADAPVLALVLASLVALAVLRWPEAAPKILAAAVAALFVLDPLIVWAVREFADLGAIEHAIPLSWAERMGYWSHAVDWISDRPLRGLGLDASRVLGPGIQLHPHNGPLQVWLELGLIGAAGAAVFWGVTLSRLGRPKRDPAMAAAAASAAVYLLFGALNFGVWQEWWLALGAYLAVLTALAAPEGVVPADRPRNAASPSTSKPVSE